MTDTIDIKRLEEQKSNAILELENRLLTWKSFQNDYQSLEETLTFLPGKISHDIMVPFGSLAFMPGKLVHTNEILVLLGDNWFAKRSASQALEIVKRRQKYVKENIESINKELEFFSSQINFTQEFENLSKADSKMVEIKEELKDDHKQKSQGPRIAHAKSKQFAPKRVKPFKPTKVKPMSEEDQKFFSKLDKLEVNETKNKELEKLDAMEEINDQKNVKLRAQGLPKRTEVTFADEVKLQSDSNSDDNSDRDQDEDNTKTILVNFTASTSEIANESSSSSKAIKTPTDIYHQYIQTPKSILKSPGIEKESLPKPNPSITEPSLRNEQDSDVAKAFSGEIIERSMKSITIQEGTKSKPKRISRFKAERKS